MPLVAVRPVSDAFKGVMLVSSEGFSLATHQTVEVSVGDRVIACTVVVEPEQLLVSQDEAVGEVVASYRSDGINLRELAMSRLSNHEAAAFPALGQWIRTGEASGRVVGLDIPHGAIRMQHTDGETELVSVSDMVVESSR